MRNVLVNGATTPLGRRLLARLRDAEGVERVVGIEPTATADRIDGVELVAFEPDHRRLVELLQELGADTVLHCGMVPDRSGASSQPLAANVIDTMRLGAAVGHPEVSVRSFVLASSTAVYPVASHAPLLNREVNATDPDEGSLAASVLEAEDYARDVAERAPHLSVAILRLQAPVGRGVRGPLARALAQPVLPRIPGFDPPVQMLHIDDAVGAMRFAAEVELAGVYNVASEGVLRWSEVAQVIGRPSAPVLPLPLGPFEGIARATGMPHVPAGLGELLRFGHAVDIAKIASAGFKPSYDQVGCLLSIARARRTA